MKVAFVPLAGSGGGVGARGVDGSGAVGTNCLGAMPGVSLFEIATFCDCIAALCSSVIFPTFLISTSPA